MADVPNILTGAFPDPRQAMGADIGPKYAIGDQSQYGRGELPWWLIPAMMALGMRRRPTSNPMMNAVPNTRSMPRVAAPANDNSRFPALDVPGAQPRPGNPDNSHVGQLNRLTADQFKVYQAARDGGMSAQQALQKAQGLGD